MFERFTDRARKVMALANQEAQRLNHEYIGTEHILLGLIREGSGIGANVLKELKIDLRKVRLETERLVKAGPSTATWGKLPQTSQGRNVIVYAIEESRNFGHTYVGTEHLLLGLIRETDGVACQVLASLNVAAEQVREHVRLLTDAAPTAPDALPRDRGVLSALRSRLRERFLSRGELPEPPDRSSLPELADAHAVLALVTSISRRAAARGGDVSPEQWADAVRLAALAAAEARVAPSLTHLPAALPPGLAPAFTILHELFAGLPAAAQRDPASIPALLAAAAGKLAALQPPSSPPSSCAPPAP